MANWLITWGGMFFPAGLVLLILPLTLEIGQAPFLTHFGILFILFSIGCFAMGLVRFQSEEKRKEERFQELVKEIRGLRNDLSRGQGKRKK